MTIKTSNSTILQFLKQCYGEEKFEIRMVSDHRKRETAAFFSDFWVHL